LAAITRATAMDAARCSRSYLSFKAAPAGECSHPRGPPRRSIGSPAVAQIATVKPRQGRTIAYASTACPAISCDSVDALPTNLHHRANAPDHPADIAAPERGRQPGTVISRRPTLKC
jgi:hypothetical protein